MNIEPKKTIPTQNHYRIRELLGWLGLLLPFILWGGNAIAIAVSDTYGESLLHSVSHYHYSYVGSIFSGVLMAFALLLISYKGHRDEIKWWKTDNTITNLAGFFAIIVVIVPTIPYLYVPMTPNTHYNYISYYIHLGSAGVFLALLGYMSVFKFTKSRYHKNLYIFCGIMVWLCIAILITGFAAGFAGGSFVFWMEAIALAFFGLSWLVKAKSRVLYWVKIISEKEWQDKTRTLQEQRFKT